MTEFRRRKDDGRVFPVRKKAYGISRQLAYADVQALRKEGKRARLIKTNRRLDLFAPYESVLPPAAEPMDVEKPKASTKAPVEKQIPQGKIDLLNQLGLVTKNGKPDLNNGVLNEYFSERTRMRATIKDGKLTFIAIDPSTISLIMETMDTNLPDGYLVPTSYGKDFSMEWVKIPPPDNRRTPRFPSLDYSKDSWTVRLEGEELKKFVKALRSVDGDVIRFNLLGGTDKSSVQLCRLEDREDSHKPAVIPLDTMNASSNHIENKDVPEGWSTAEMVLMSKEYVTKTLTAMLGRKSYMNPTDQVLTLQLKQDYPLVLKTRRIGPNGEHIEIDGAVAPRMGE
jgi:hypothetical protein